MLGNLTSIRRRAAITAVTLLAAAIVPLTAAPAHAAIITVAAGEVAVAENNVCSLREAVLNANDAQTHDDCAGGTGVDTIQVPAGTYLLGTGGELSITDSDLTTISGAGATTILDGEGTTRIFNVAASATVAITDVTITNGSASVTGGGGILHAGGLTLANSTLSNNTADFGGAIVNTGTATVTNSTLSNNTADTGGGLSNAGGTVTLIATIVANNSGGNISGLIIDTGNNFLAGNPMLAPLADNGGPTMTHALLPLSPAIDAAACGLLTDQRGVARPQGVTCDIGAFELAAAAVITLTPPEATNPVGTTHTVTATVTVGGTAVTGWTVTFTITGGPNAGASGTCTVSVSCATGPAGTVSFTYLSNGTAGTDTITATVNNGFGVPISTDPVDKTWTPLPGGGGGGGGGDDDDDDDDVGGGGGGGGSGRRGRITIVEDVRPDRDVAFGFHTKNLKATTAWPMTAGGTSGTSRPAPTPWPRTPRPAGS